MRVSHDRRVADIKARAARESEAAFAVRRPSAAERRARLQRDAAEIDTDVMRVGVARAGRSCTST